MWDELIENFDMTIDKEDIVKMEEKKAIEKFRKFGLKKFRKEKIKNNDLLSYVECMIILNLIKKLHEENEELKADLYSANSIINEYVEMFKGCISKEIELRGEDVKAMLENPEKYFKIRTARYKG